MVSCAHSFLHKNKDSCMKNRAATFMIALLLVVSHSAYTSDNVSRVGLKLSSKKVLSPQISVLAALFNLPLNPVVKKYEGEFEKYKSVRRVVEQRVFTPILQVRKYNGR